MLNIQSYDSLLSIELGEMQKDAKELGYESSTSIDTTDSELEKECFFDKFMKWCYQRKGK